MKLVFVCLGGAAGALCRYLTSVLMAKFTEEAVWATVTVNLLGSFLIGIVFIWLKNLSNIELSENMRLLIMIGFLGAFTTFSAYSVNLYELINKNMKLAVIYFIISNVGGLLLFFAGVWIANKMHSS